MSTPSTSDDPAAAGGPLGVAYLALLPTIRRTARWYFRHVPCPDQRRDFECEAVALGWLRFVRLAGRRKDPAAFAATFAYTLARAVRSGRRLCGQETAKDVLSRVCRHRRRFTVSSLADGPAMTGAEFDDALRHNTQTPVPEQVQFRIDFPRWRGGLPAGRRRAVDLLATGERTDLAAARLDVSPSRVSQVRRELHDSWTTFCEGDPV